MKLRLFFFVLLINCSWLTSCEETITLDILAGKEQLVVHGHIEQQAPPFVFLTRSTPVFSGTDPTFLAGSFVHNATISISTGGPQTVTLREVRLRDLPMAHQQLVSEQFGLHPAITATFPTSDFYVYTSDELKGQTGQRYTLHIQSESKILEAVTTIPAATPVDSLWFVAHPDPKQDSLLTLWYRYRDPDTLGNNIRYFTSRNAEPFYPGYLTSVFTDEFVNGRSIQFPLERGYPKSAKVDLETYSYFRRGDTVRLKWASLDYPHYQFWFTLEADRASNGNPFGFPTTVRSNIKGGLGVWGGYGVSHHTVISK